MQLKKNLYPYWQMEQQIKVSCQKSNLKKIRAFLKEYLATTILSASEAHLVVVAVDEVCTNLMVHSHNCNPKIHLEIKTYQTEGNLTIDIYDKGPIFHINDYIEPSVERLIEDRRKGGLGLILVKKIMDRILVLQENGYNIYRMQRAV